MACGVAGAEGKPIGAGEPGARTRSGTVEPDITAVTRGVRDGGTVVAALSIIGPTHRMERDTTAVASEALAQAATRLERQLGLAGATEPGS